MQCYIKIITITKLLYTGLLCDGSCKCYSLTKDILTYQGWDMRVRELLGVDRFIIGNLLFSAKGCIRASWSYKQRCVKTLKLLNRFNKWLVVSTTVAEGLISTKLMTVLLLSSAWDALGSYFFTILKNTIRIRIILFNPSLSSSSMSYRLFHCWSTHTLSIFSQLYLVQ